MGSPYLKNFRRHFVVKNFLVLFPISAISKQETRLVGGTRSFVSCTAKQLAALPDAKALARASFAARGALSAALLGFVVFSITTNTILPFTLLTYSFAFPSTCFPFQNLFFRVPKHVLSGFRIRHLKDGERALCSLKDEPACGRWKTTPLSGLFKTTSVTE